MLGGWVLLLHAGLTTHFQRGSPTGLGHDPTAARPTPVLTVVAPRWHAPPPAAAAAAAQEAVATTAPGPDRARGNLPAARAVAVPPRAPNAPKPGAGPMPRGVPGDMQSPPTAPVTAARPDLPAQSAPSPNPPVPATQLLPAEDAPLPPVAPGTPPPLYATRLPAATTLRYQLHDYGRVGEAQLHWQPDGQRYALQFTGVASRPAPSPEGVGASPAAAARHPAALSHPLIEQTSEGALDPNGLAPDRFTDRRRGRGVGAANFRRDRDRIEFSGPAIAYPAWPGAQDRLSWLVQLVAIAAAQAGAGAAATSAPAALALFVVDARGGGELWRFDDLGPALADTAQGPVPAHHWRHLPLRPEGQQVDVWLDPARGHWPAQMRFSAGRSAARFELRLDSP